MLQHKHILINAKVKNPLKTPEDGVGFLTRLVYAIQMKIIKGPFASYVEAEGNRGLTAVVMIETSHIAFHIWDENDPSMLQFDLYTCSTLPVEQVIKNLEDHFGLFNYSVLVLERSEGFKVIPENKWSDLA